MKHKKNFTLVELLVVIVIIAILAGMLLPALNSARGFAKNIQCVNLMKGMGIGFMGYANDYGYWIPFHTPLGASARWYSKQEVLNYFNFPKTGVWAANAVVRNCLCPEKLSNPTGDYAKFCEPKYGLLDLTYGLPMPLGPDFAGSTAAEDYIITMSKVKKPSSKLGLLETLNGGRVFASNVSWFSAVPQYPENASNAQLAYRHRGFSSNCLFMDCHVSSEKSSFYSGAYTSGTQAYYSWRPYY